MVYDGNLSKTGPIASNAIYNTGTTKAGTRPCQLALSLLPLAQWPPLARNSGRRWATAELAGLGKT